MAERKTRRRKPDLKLVGAPEPPDRPILPLRDARRRYLLYVAVKLLGLAALFGGVFLGKDGLNWPAGLLLVAGAISLFIRPAALGLASKR